MDREIKEVAIILELYRAKKGDKKAFEEWIENNKQYMYHIAIAILNNDDDAADAICETIVKTFINLKSLRNLEYAKTWMTRILINECRKILRQKKKMVYLGNYPESTKIACEEKQKEKEMDLKLAIEKLDKKLKDVVLLYYFNELSVKEIADMLKIPQGTVKSRLNTARRYLYKILSQERRENNGV